MPNGYVTQHHHAGINHLPTNLLLVADPLQVASSLVSEWQAGTPALLGYNRDLMPVLCGTNLLVERLSLNRSQCGGCSTKYDTPTES